MSHELSVVNPFTTIHDGNFRRHSSCYITIHDGNFRRIYYSYKPESLYPDMHFGLKVKWLNEGQLHHNVKETIFVRYCHIGQIKNQVKFMDMSTERILQK